MRRLPGDASSTLWYVGAAVCAMTGVILLTAASTPGRLEPVPAEESSGFDCKAMGNHACGPVTLVLRDEGWVVLDDDEAVILGGTEIVDER